MNIKKSQNVSRDVPVFVTPEMKAKGVFDLVHPNVQRDIPVVVTPEMQAAGVSAYPSGNNVQPAYQNNTAPANNNLPTNNIQTSAPSSSNEDFLKSQLNEVYFKAGGKYLNGTFNFDWMNDNKININNKIDSLPLSYQAKIEIKNHLNEVIKKRSASNNMLEKLIKMANLLDDIGFNVESDELTKIAIKLAKKKKNVPNNPSLWASCKAWAKSTFDVYPSAYSNGAAAKRYKSKGGTWRKSE
jgi:hypothetical protein